jgi:hypothetical protein
MSMLIKDLQRVAAKKLRNTRGVPQSMKGKVELIELAFGHAAVVDDFTKWCEENAERNPEYPVFDYLRIVDSRLGGEHKIDPKDPSIEDLCTMVYELTAVLPRVRAVRELLCLHDADEIKAALKEYLLNVDEKNYESAMRSFFDDQGAGAIIRARKKRGL